MGYTPNLVVGAWAGNNDNTPMQDSISALIITPLWGAFMSQVAKNFPPENFKAPPPPNPTSKPVLHGIWQGGVSYWQDTISGKVATQYTPQETRKEVVLNSVHNILQWVDKDDPQGPYPVDPTTDSQYENWEYAVRTWFQTWQTSHPDFREVSDLSIPSAIDDVHTPENMPQISIVSPIDGTTIDPQQILPIQLQESGRYPPQKTDVYVNGKYVLTASANPLNFSFVPNDVGSLSATNTLSVIFYDSVQDQAQASTTFLVNQ